MGIKSFFRRFFKDVEERPDEVGKMIQLSLEASRKKHQPHRETDNYPQSLQWGNIDQRKVQYKSTPSNIRYFTRTPYVRRAINRIREPISSLPWEIVPLDEIKTNSHLQQQIDVATNCFNHPNNDDSWRSFIGLVTEDLLTFGAGVFEQELGGDKIRPLWMWPVDAQSIQIYAGWSGNANEARYLQTYGFTNVGLTLNGKQLRNDQIVYAKTNDANDSPFGFGAVEIAFSAINRKLGVESFAGNLAANAAPEFLLHLPGADTNTINAFRTWWRNAIEAQGQIPLWGGKDKPEAVKFYPGGDASLYLEYQDTLIREIATAFGISPQNLSIEADVNRNTAEVAEDRDFDTAVKPVCHLYQNYFTREVLHRKLGFYQLQFKFVGIEREDEQSIADIYETEYKNNATTPNEYRAKRNNPPLDNQFADMTAADVEIAVSAARGLAVLEDKNLKNTEVKTSSQKNKKVLPGDGTKTKKQKGA